MTVSATQATRFSHSKLFSSVLQWRLENRFEGEINGYGVRLSALDGPKVELRVGPGELTEDSIHHQLSHRFIYYYCAQTVTPQ